MIQGFASCQRQIAFFFILLFVVEFATISKANAAYYHNPARRTHYTQNDFARRPLPFTSDNDIASNKSEFAYAAAGTPLHKENKFTTGPTQPEMQSFQSVNTNNMVDLFSGDFSYNIPLLDVGGYPISLHYNSGITMDQEASWVGLGWNINPGAITRNMRGLPDDFNGEDKVTKTFSIKSNKLIGVTGGFESEVTGVPLRVGAKIGVFYNNYRGWGIETGINTHINAATGAKGELTGGLSLTNNSQGGFSAQPSISFEMASKNAARKGSVNITSNYNSRTGIDGLQMTGEYSRQNNAEKNNRIGISANTGISFATPSYTPSITIPFTTHEVSFRAKLGTSAKAVFPNGYVKGYGSIQSILPQDRIQRLSAFGYLYYQKAQGNQRALLDMNREKEMEYRDKVPHIAVPFYTYDSYSITGEGTGGMFRPYRGDVGYIYDHAMSSKSDHSNFSGELGPGGFFHGGIDYDGEYTTTKNNPWFYDNLLKDVIPFRQSDSTFENVYFKNPGEKTLADQKFFDAIGDTKLMRVDLQPLSQDNNSRVTATRTLTTFNNATPGGKITLGQNVFRQKRDRRSQLISYLAATDAQAIGLDKFIRSYGINQFPSGDCNENYRKINRVDTIRRPHHLSEMTVLNGDGRRYVYGVPVYNFSQSDVSFSVSKDGGNKLTGQVTYTKNGDAADNTVNNNKGKDNYFNKEELPAYTHSFLLSGILSPDYVDITGDGITEDDNGEAIRFNYSQVYGTSKEDGYKWRAPFDSAAYSEGFKTDSRDDKGSYAYGEREVWYLNSVASKTMLATFVLETDSIRQDGFGVAGENGSLDQSRKLYRLKKINLYSKSDYLKNGQSAKPIKTVHFAYSYELCKNNPSSLSGKGKLTLKKVWFTYNGNRKDTLNPYVFSYPGKNPDYLKGAVDRWGNFKDSRNNPAQLANMDYPYALQSKQNGWDSTQAASDAAAWALSKIKLPSGGELRVTYESDDYAYVQNKRAMQMFSLAGFGNSPSAAPVSRLYKPFASDSDYHYVFINVTEQVNSKEEIREKYLQSVSKLYFKLFVRMPDDPKWGSGSEYVPLYADIENDEFGIKGNPSDKMIWIRLKAIDEESPAAVAALQFLRLNLPSKAYPGSEPGDNVDVRDVIKMLVSVVDNVTDATTGYGNRVRRENLCNSITPGKSFVRLNNPLYKKLGGGLRVKRIEVFDNFRAMTKQQQQDATYGHEYDYSTTIMVNNAVTRISSGVASYEPAIGNEENPFHVPIEFTENIAPLAPTNYKYTEEPLCETYFPGASVGYSKVKVQSIHKDRKSATGHELTEFYTTADFPTIVEYTPLDADSKKTFNPPFQNFLRINARNDVTLSQGFKVELNDMNGKLKSQSSFAQNDSLHPISYTYNYYNVENERSLHKKLSTNVKALDSANGALTVDAQIGKDVEIMVDFREQTSSSVSGSLNLNLELVAIGIFPIPIPTAFSLPNIENNRFRSVAVVKVVNRYGVLDSVIHMEKGSKVSTKNMIYDAETGDVLLSKTNNEFDDPVYNFVYPSHFAYTGMGSAYKNWGALWSKVQFTQGKLYHHDYTPFDSDRHFESGDELYVLSGDQRVTLSGDTCSASFAYYTGTPTYKRVWAINADKGLEKHNGLYFIDKNGIPFNATNADIRIIRSGHRNMPSAPIGSITSLQNPLRVVQGQERLVFDSTTEVVVASAAKFKDLWRVDSSLYKKDTTIIVRRLADSITGRTFYADEMYKIENTWPFPTPRPKDYFTTHSYDEGGHTYGDSKSWAKFNLAGAGAIPANAVITSASLRLYNEDYLEIPKHQRFRGTSTSSFVRRILGSFPTDGGNLGYYYVFYHETALGATDNTTQAIIPTIPNNTAIHRSDTLTVTSMVQGMVSDHYSKNIPTAIVMGLLDPTGDLDKENHMIYQFYPNNIEGYYRPPAIITNYCLPCSNGLPPSYSSTPVAGFYCNDLPKDTVVCRPNIVDSAVNPYRWGILGNWRMDRAYTYYDNRKQSDPDSTTNIRKDGEIKSFVPYWAFNETALTASTDSSRWVWNSEMTLFNRKGYDIENHDPLNRYNAGQYGYQQSMPVAVAQNARNREAMFDGFEDYGYNTDTCKSCPSPRFIDFSNGGGAMVDSMYHTGRYSMRVAGGGSDTTKVKIASLAEDALLSGLSARIDTSFKVVTTVTGSGSGLDASYFDPSGPLCHQRVDPTIEFTWNGNPLPPGCPNGLFTATWEGKIQPRYSDVYKFETTVEGWVQVYVNGQLVVQMQNDNYQFQSNVQLTAGELYNITVHYGNANEGGGGSLKLFWTSLSGQQPTELVPQSQLYVLATEDSSIASTIIHDTTFCILPRTVRPRRVTLDRFSPIQSQKMLVSAWVREDQVCTNGTYENSQVQLVFTGGSTTTITLTPKGKVIEGWQRIEEFVSIPSTATAMTIKLKSTNAGIPVFFDDVRIHPFNSNVKSFVYDPINLRLMAELDENNYATFYEYDDDGTLVRLKKETERGIKTIKETRSALLKD
jgi:hypothetical protein